MAIYKLDNHIQNYTWGSSTSMSQLFGFDNKSGEPQAELWMGAHKNGCSQLQKTGMSLADYIADNKEARLGAYTLHRFGELPFLFKVLAAEAPLSIQVHPNKMNSKLGYERENALGIDANATNRNYKDTNHKPELIYALTTYRAMNGFRPIEHIIALFNEIEIPTLSDEVSLLKGSPTPDGLEAFFSAIMSLAGQRKVNALDELYASYSLNNVSPMALEALQYSQTFFDYYEEDVGLLAPLILNTVELSAGEAMFLHAETPHAYVHGTALEIMASSDNVLRAGLTHKHIDVPELIANTRFQPILPDQLKLLPVLKEGGINFPVPVDDFAFDILHVESVSKTLFVRGAEILFCIEGVLLVRSGETSVHLKAGESVFIPYSASMYNYQGVGRLARAYC